MTRKSMLDAAAWTRAKDLFEPLVELPVDRRAAELSRVCGDDSALREALESLLSAHEGAGDFLSGTSIDITAIESSITPATGTGEAPGQQVGRYALLEVLGEGGFGTVFRARQDEPVRREVALKVLKPGMDSRQVVARFEAERQALALMDHPSIARVFDGGQTDTGRPYFVMELVDGLPITQHCDQRRLKIDERLSLFAEVCRAVHHAHQKGVIHRDLKPANVLVATVDGVATPKVIDFGVAKAIGEALTNLTLETSDRQLIGTPAYMSPEQIAMGGRDVDIRSDVYSLGVLLYELLTGRTPFDASGIDSWRIGAVARWVQEEVPERPSTRFRRGGASRSGTDADESNGVHDATRNAELRGADPRALSVALRGELDWIVMKCLEKDRGRRYSAASELVEELERFRRGEPVRAGPPSPAYRFRKFAARHRAAIAAACFAVLVLLTGLTLAVTGFVTAEQARALAVTREREALAAARKAEAISNFLQEMIAAADPREVATRDLRVSEALDRAVKRLDDGALREQPDIDAAVRMNIGRAYRELARYADSAPQLEAAVQTYAAMGDAARADLSIALQERGTLHEAVGDIAASTADLRRAVELARSAGVKGERLAGVVNDLGTILISQPDRTEAEALLREALAMLEDPQLQDSPRIAEVANNLGLLLALERRFDEAEPLYRQAVEVNRRALGDDHPSLATNLDNLAQLLAAGGKPDDADEAYQEAIRIRRKVLGDRHPDLAVSLHNHAVLLFTRGEYDGCEAALREALQIFTAVHGLANLETLTILDSLVSVLARRGALDEAETLLHNAFEAATASDRLPDQRKEALARRLSDLYTARNRPDEAQIWGQKADALRPPASQPTP